MNRNRFLHGIAKIALLASLALSGTFAACGNNKSTPESPGGGMTPFNGTVRVVDFMFVPRDITVSVGDSVTWSFAGTALHTVTEGAQKNNPSPLFDSGLKKSGTFGYRFMNPGTIPYHCIPHFDMNMRGTVIVQ